MRGRKLLGLLSIGVLVGLASGLLAPEPDPARAADFAAVGAGGQHTCALTTAGGVQCWGQNEHGQLGDGTYEDSATPVDVQGLEADVTAIAVGEWHACALTTAGGVQCWGEGFFGALGDGTNTTRATPVTVCESGSGSGPDPCVPLDVDDIAAMTAGAYHTCVLTISGGVKCWGRNYEGQLGDGTTTYSVNPVDVVGLTTGVAVVAGAYHTCALLEVSEESDVQCWGNNDDGQLGDGTTTDSSVPVDVLGLADIVLGVGLGGGHTCALITGGGVQCWGDNAAGQLGDGTIIDKPVPAAVLGLQAGVAAVTAGDVHSCVVMIAGGMKCWGWDAFGQLGDGSEDWWETQSIAADVTGLTGAAGEPVVDAAAAGSGHTCALTNLGVVTCWGWNSHGQLGESSTIGLNNPSALGRDFDKDGCVDERELGSDATQGGRRHPKYFWDFYDVWTHPEGDPGSWERDRTVDMDVGGDFYGVYARFGKTGDPNGDPLVPPTDETSYHPAFDRGPVLPGGDPWDMGPPDGSIDLFVDLFGVAAQNGHDCREAP